MSQFFTTGISTGVQGIGAEGMVEHPTRPTISPIGAILMNKWNICIKNPSYRVTGVAIGYAFVIMF